MTTETTGFTEEQHEQRPTSGFTSPRKRRLIIIAVVVTLIVIAIIIAIVVPVVLMQNGTEEESESPKPNTVCGLTLPEGVNMSDIQGPIILSRRFTCDIVGSCWKKEECYQCFEGPNKDRIGNINNMPVCCPQCTRHGLRIFWDECDCMNGDS